MMIHSFFITGVTFSSFRRVPPSQGLEFYYALSVIGTPTRCLVYENNNHALSGAEASADAYINAALWFANYLYK
jgi:acylaminoacyl-peptidase